MAKASLGNLEIAMSDFVSYHKYQCYGKHELLYNPIPGRLILPCYKAILRNFPPPYEALSIEIPDRCRTTFRLLATLDHGQTTRKPIQGREETLQEPLHGTV